ncbi:hypothetical protein CGLO_00045 [Colletotrichum gloeosporioides Cg-14]|uniref:Uncharacterized protein n=1 Tax=Colletotrichum gloeosporioides (strain Cg-14) TaxID=1237896 RepID=T0L4A5_COLGC|nr:hypothetical protein CGLO_00045 [Colletotrichum gloeosporioides Cg-14]
MTTKSLEDKTF